MHQAGYERPAPESKKPANIMPTHPEHHNLNHLFELIDGLDEGGQWSLVRELKLTAHTIAKDMEQSI